MKYEKVRVFANHIKIADKTTKLTAYENKEKIVDKDLSAVECLILIEGMIPAMRAALIDKGRAEWWVPHHGYHA